MESTYKAALSKPAEGKSTYAEQCEREKKQMSEMGYGNAGKGMKPMYGKAKRVPRLPKLGRSR